MSNFADKEGDTVFGWPKRDNPVVRRIHPEKEMDPGMKELYQLLQKWMLNVIETLEFMSESIQTLDKKKADVEHSHARAVDDGVSYED